MCIMVTYTIVVCVAGPHNILYWHAEIEIANHVHVPLIIIIIIILQLQPAPWDFAFYADAAAYNPEWNFDVDCSPQNYLRVLAPFKDSYHYCNHWWRRFSHHHLGRLTD